MQKCCMGHILEVDLSNGEIKKTRVPEQVYDALLGGKGLGTWYCLKNIPAGADPMGPDNVLGFCAGALTGTGALMAGRWTMVGKSPLTGGWGDASCGGMFAPAIKQCGVDAIFFRGISAKPVYLYMDNKVCELRDASPYWGLDATEAEDRLIADTKEKKLPRVAVIGQAGEKRSLISGICNDHGRIAARSGLGAVMGGKNLKAVVLVGSRPIPCAEPERMKELSSQLGRKVKHARLPGFIRGGIMRLSGWALGAIPLVPPMRGSWLNMLYRRWGTPMFQNMCLAEGDSPVKNWSGSARELPGIYKDFDPDRVLALEKAKYHCYSCPLGCGGTLDGKKLGCGMGDAHKPEYESMNQFGPLLMNRDLESLFLITEKLNRAGMDSISAGGTVAWAIECYENGLLTLEDTDGLDLRWGNTEAILKLVDKMIAREGFGDLLADGSKRAAQRLGRGSEKYAMHIGGQEPPAHDSRNDPMLALNYAAEPAPGKHTVAMTQQYAAMAVHRICTWAPRVRLHSKKRDRLPLEEVAMANVANVCYTMLTDSAGACYYGEMMGTDTYRLVEYLDAGTGIHRSGDEYMAIGKRVQTMRQLFNVKQGLDLTKIRLPKRMLGYPALTGGPNKGVQLAKAEEQIRLHWKSFGWDEATGIPTEETVKALGIPALMELEVQ